MNFIKFCSVASGIQHPKVQLVLAFFEAHTELLPFVSILSLIATTYLEFNPNWNSAPIHFTAKYTKLSYAVAKIAYFPAFA